MNYGAAIGRAFAFLSLHREGASRFGCEEYRAPEIVGVVYLHGDGAVERRQFSVVDRVEVVQVFLGTDQGAGSCGASLMENFVVVLVGVAVMIGEEFVTDDIETPRAQVVQEG